ncbi:zinc finger BED domain-containing protein RICESLEEPER 2-like [Spinacia oleracea]|uniref:Zinc finger BED domain-containing protein RICESLEEPER 2-like n=1 Tax=Spinacia oleracea TaxID=3562 RepID=A0ABM3QYR9_SPIOL|nr:zinc finger BED domain-containing protein RICESLEEPER 2-like [Spinacia oleracea]
MKGSQGTTTPTNHIKVCPRFSQLEITSPVAFDQQILLRLFAKDIIYHVYLLTIVEHIRVWLSYLNPLVRHITRNTILKHCIREYDMYKNNLHKVLQNLPGKVSFTYDLWTACLAVEKFVLNLIEQWNLEGKALCMTVDNARKVCKRLMNVLCQFERSVSDANIVFKEKLCLDVVTRWNATFLMFHKALEATYALILYAQNYFLIDYHLSPSEWLIIKDVYHFLKMFYDITIMFSGSEYPTANLYFENIFCVEYNLKEAHKNPILAFMAEEMLVKFEEYWDEYSLFLSIVVVLDHPHKLQRVRKAFYRMYVERASGERTKKVNDALYDIYKHYHSQLSASSFNSRNSETLRLTILMKIQRGQGDDEGEARAPFADLEKYLNTSRSRKVEGENFDVLAFSILESMGGRIATKYRGALFPKHIEVMVTSQNWSRGYGGDIDEDVLVVRKEMEVENI